MVYKINFWPSKEAYLTKNVWKIYINVKNCNWNKKNNKIEKWMESQKCDALIVEFINIKKTYEIEFNYIKMK